MRGEKDREMVRVKGRKVEAGARSPLSYWSTAEKVVGGAAD